MANTPINTVGISGDTASSTGGQIDFSSLLPTILDKFIAVIEGVLIIIAGIFAIRYVRSKLQKFETQHEQQKTAVNLFEKITSGFIIVVALTLALKVVGLDMTLLVSVAILGLSYGLQDIIKNYVAGILILFKAPFKIGDVVKIRDFTGKVGKIDFQSTTLNTFDSKQITIYNSDVMTQSIVNYTNNTMRRLEIEVTVGYGSDVPKALMIFNQILSSDPTILKSPKHSISFKKYGDTGVTFVLKFWIQRPCNILKLRTAIAAQIAQTFDEENIMSPYTKDIQTEEESQLSKIPEKRKNRIATFYSQPAFAVAAEQPEITPPPTGTPEEQAAAEAADAALPSDFEEPEA